MLEKIIKRTNLYIDSMPKAERKRYGQFFTSMETARFMAGLYENFFGEIFVCIFYCGAGAGGLCCWV